MVDESESEGAGSYMVHGGALSWVVVGRRVEGCHDTRAVRGRLKHRGGLRRFEHLGAPTLPRVSLTRVSLTRVSLTRVSLT
eukprot:6819926-Pyramimonas_sp.AAC.1